MLIILCSHRSSYLLRFEQASNLSSETGAFSRFHTSRDLSKFQICFYFRFDFNRFTPLKIRACLIQQGRKTHNEKCFTLLKIRACLTPQNSRSVLRVGVHYQLSTRRYTCIRTSLRFRPENNSKVTVRSQRYQYVY